jgi:dTDP-4-amino-4,6-dideoxygalactose transaminase
MATTGDVLIPLVDLKVQYRSIKREIDDAIARVLESGEFILGKEVAAFEKEFAAYCGASYCVGLNSGTSALHLAMLAAGIGPGDEVITVPFTFVATVAAIHYTGATPVFVDIDRTSCTMDPGQLEHAITPRTKAIVPVHLYGQPAHMDPILEIARRYGLIVIEDAAQAHGAQYKGRRAGSLGEMGCFSFYPGKNLGAYGEGGAVITNNAERADIIRRLRDWGQSRRYFHDIRGFNYRMEGLQAAILLVKLRHLEGWTEARRSNAKLYREALAAADIELPAEMSYSRHVYHIFAVRASARDRMMRELSNSGVQVGIHYPIPVHLQKAYADGKYKEGDYPVAEEIANTVLSLPIFAEMTRKQIDTVAAIVIASAARLKSAQ